MFKKLGEKLRCVTDARKLFDPSQIGDPIATQTEWTPAKRCGVSLRTYQLVKIESNRIEFKASIRARLFYSVFILIGMTVLIAVPVANSSSSKFSFNTFTLLASLVSVAVGGFMFRFGTTPIVFDKYKGFFWKGWIEPDEADDRQEIKYFAELDDIHALQLISKVYHSSKKSYYNYELNLVLKNGSRINVADHGNLMKLKEDAQVLSKYLGKPLWDAI